MKWRADEQIETRLPLSIVVVPVVERDLPVPRISFDRKFEVRVPSLFPKQPPELVCGHMRIKTSVAICRAAEKGTPAANQPVPATRARDPVIARGHALPQLLIRPQGREDVLLATELRQEQLDTRSGHFSGLDEDEPVRMRHDHECPNLP